VAMCVMSRSLRATWLCSYPKDKHHHFIFQKAPTYSRPFRSTR
jgi:hypothetical protein